MRAKLVGLPEALRGLREFKENIQRKWTKIALAAAGGVLKQEAIKRAPTETKTLQKNLTVKTSLSKDKRRAYSVVGAKRGVKVAVTTKDNKTRVVATYRKKKDGTIAVSGEKRLAKTQAAGSKIRYRVPSRYIHLAEKKNKSLFLKQTIAAKKDEAANKAIAKVKEGIEVERRNALAKSKRV